MIKEQKTNQMALVIVLTVIAMNIASACTGGLNSSGQSDEQVQSPPNEVVENPSEYSPDADTTDLDACVGRAILNENAGHYSEGDFAAESHVVLKTEESGNTATVYAVALYLEFTYEDTGFSVASGSHMPVALTFEKDTQGQYELIEYWMPREGTEYAPSIEEKFPADIYREALDTQEFIQAGMQDCYAQAIEYGDVDTVPIIAGLLETICSSPAESSDPGAYIEAHAYEYRELLYFGNATLRYAYERFQAEGQTDLQGQILLLAARELTGDEDLEYPLDSSCVVGN
jgi:hypothetical protein